MYCMKGILFIKCLVLVCKLNYSFCSLPSFTSLWYEGLILYAGESACLSESVWVHMLQDLIIPCSSVPPHPLIGPLINICRHDYRYDVHSNVHQGTSASRWVGCGMMQERYHGPTEAFTPFSDSRSIQHVCKVGFFEVLKKPGKMKINHFRFYKRI